MSLALFFLASTSGVTGTSFTNQEASLDNVLRGWMCSVWLQTTQADFEAGLTNNVSTTVSPGDLVLDIEVNPVTIASDNLESGGWGGGSGWLGNWSYSGDIDVTTQGNPNGGYYHVRLRGSTGYMDRVIDLSGQTGVRLQFWAKANSFESGETATCLVSPDGVDWTTVQTWVDGDDDNSYHLYDIDLSGFTMLSQFYLAFEANMSAANDFLYVDDLAIITGPQYYNTGTITSQVLDTEAAGTDWIGLSWNETFQSGTDITFEVRASDTSFGKGAASPSWTAIGGTSPVTNGLPSGEYMQWRAILSNSDPTNTPTLHEVTIYYD